jgi:hypothetical protein
MTAMCRNLPIDPLFPTTAIEKADLHVQASNYWNLHRTDSRRSSKKTFNSQEVLFAPFGENDAVHIHFHPAS